MPFYLKQDEEEQKKQQNNPSISGSNVIINSSNPANTVTSFSPTQKSSGSFTNLQTYLDANKEKAAEMGANVSGKVDSSAIDASAQISNLGNNLQQVNKVTDESLNNDFYNDPTKANKEAYTSIKSGYTGPNEISKVDGYSGAIDSWNKASQNLKNASTEDGRKELLKEAYNRPSYTSGQNALDQSLVQNNAESKAAFENVQNKWSGLTSMLDDKTTNVGSKIASNLANDSANKTLINQNEANVMDNLTTGLTQKAKQINESKLNANKIVTSGLNSSQALSQEELGKLGITSEQWKNIQDSVALVKSDTGVDKSSLNQYANNNLKPVSAQSIATSAEYERFAALNNLIDGNSSFLSDPSLAGTDSANYEAIDFKNFSSGILEPINSKINTLSRMIDSPASFGNFNDFDRLAASIAPSYATAGLNGAQRKQILINALNESKSKAQQITKYFNNK